MKKPAGAAAAPAKTSQGPAGPDRKPWYIAGVIGALVGFAALVGVFDGLDHKWSDKLFTWRGMEKADPRVIIISIDDESIKRVGQYPWQRKVYKRLLDRMQENGVKATALDILYLEPSDTRPGGPLGPQDRALIEATRRWGVKLVHATSRDPSKLNENVFRPPFEGLNRVLKSRGVVDQMVIHGDGSVRSTNLVYGGHPRDSTAWPKDPNRVASLGAKALSVYEGVDPDEYVKRHGNYVVLNIRGEQTRVIGKSTNAQGEQIDIEKKEYGITRVPVWEILEDPIEEDTKEKLNGAIALVGYTALGTYDHYPSPFTESQPGVEVHANVIDNLLHGRFLKPVPGLLTVALAIGFALTACGALQLGPMIGATVAFLTLVGWAGVSYYAFLSLRLVEFSAPALSLLGSFGVLLVRKTLSEQAEKKFIKQTFGQFVAPEVVDKLVKDPSQLKLGGEKREMTAFFLDIAHFTDISEKMTPEELIQFLNKYLSVLSKVVQDHHGVVDKYIGDCVMAFWNAPLDDAEHRANACLSAVECQAEVAELNKTWDYQKFPEAPAIRIGVNSGNMVVGLTGSEKKLAYTVLGDEVNLASRLEGANKFFGSKIMVSEAAYEGAKHAVEARTLGRVKVIGKVIPILVYELVGLKGKLTPEWQKALPIYEKGVQLFLDEKFAEAKEAFGAVIKVFPGDTTAKLYYNACEDYMAIPPMGEWRVFKLTAK